MLHSNLFRSTMGVTLFAFCIVLLRIKPGFLLDFVWAVSLLLACVDAFNGHVCKWLTFLGTFSLTYCFSGLSAQANLSAMAILCCKLFDVHVRLYHLVEMANFLSLAIRPSVEKLLASCGDRYLGKDLLIGLTHIYPYMEERSTHPMSTWNCHSLIHLLNHRRCTIPI